MKVKILKGTATVIKKKMNSNSLTDFIIIFVYWQELKT